MLTDDKHLQDVLIRRICSRINVALVREICSVHEIAIAGGSLLDAEPHDFDVYAANDTGKLNLRLVQSNAKRKGWTYVTETKNALTLKDPQGRTYQFCTFCRPTPQELVAAFDFAHCQVCVSNYGDDGNWKAYYTENFLQAMASQRTFFVGSPYPMGALCRVVKYAKYGYYGQEGRAWIRDVFKILNAFVRRGFGDYDDFKDQVDAVDLGFEGSEVLELWESIRGTLDCRNVVPVVPDAPVPLDPSKPDDDEFPF